jgi:hypothetical protein
MILTYIKLSGLLDIKRIARTDLRSSVQLVGVYHLAHIFCAVSGYERNWVTRAGRTINDLTLFDVLAGK